MIRPPCFDSQGEYDDYMERLAVTAPKRASYCWDCTERYQREMLQEGRCRHSEVKFAVVKGPLGEDLQGLR